MPYTDIRIDKSAYYHKYNGTQPGSGWQNGFRVESNSVYYDTGFFWLNASDLSAFNAMRSELTITRAGIVFPISTPIWMVVSGTLGTTTLTKSNYSSATPPFSTHVSQSITLPGGNDLNTFREISSSVLTDLLTGNYGIIVKTSGTTDYYSVNSSAIALRIEYNYKSSTITPDNPSVNCGASIGITLTTTGTSDPPDASYTHVVKCTLGNQTLTASLAAGVTTHIFNVPIGWCSEIPNATSAVGAVACETFNGTKSFGETSAALTFIVPGSVKPTAGTITCTASNALDDTPISNGSLTASLSGQAGAYGSTIVAYQLSCEGHTSANSNLVIASVPLVHTAQGYRDVTVTATVTDSRGRTESTTTSVRVYEWDVPYFTDLSVKRCDSTGQLTDAGTFVRVEGTYTCFSVNNLNSVQSCTIKVVETATGTEFAGGTLTSGGFVILGTNIQGMTQFETRKEYAIQLTLTDEVTSITYESIIYSTVYAIQFKYGGTGVAFGQAATEDETVRINPQWALIVGDSSNNTEFDVVATLADLVARVSALEGN